MTAVGYLKTHEKSSCFGCEACVQICPHSAISMVPREMPPQQPKEDKVVEALRALIQSKARAERLASQLPGALSAAVEKSSRLMAEDLCREAGYMLPQSENSRAFLKLLKDYPGIPADLVDVLLQTIPFPDSSGKKSGGQNTEKWKCSVCGYIHEGPLPPDFKCPVCGQGADKFVKVEEPRC